jgi:hypothetical protein
MLKTLLNFICLSLIFVSSSFSQEVSGIVLSSNLRDTLLYVNIGIENKDIGTVSNNKGEFNLEVEKQHLSDSLKFSMIGYKSKTVPLKAFNGYKTIILEEQITELQEVIVSNKTYKSIVLGNEKPESFLASLSFNKLEAGNEIGIKVKISKPTIIDTFNLVVIENEYESLDLRINFYDVTKNEPNQRINKKNIIVRTANVVDGLITVDLTEYDLVLQDDFFVSVESLNKLDGKKIVFGGKVLKKSLARSTSQASWSKVKMGFCIYLTARE